jgi:uncharacterized membrane protein
MDIDKPNIAEWNDDKNWSRFGLWGIYFSKVDSRLWVPKVTPGLGWTINFAHRGAVAMLLAVIALPTLAAAVYIVAFAH